MHEKCCNHNRGSWVHSKKNVKVSQSSSSSIVSSYSIYLYLPILCSAFCILHVIIKSVAIVIKVSNTNIPVSQYIRKFLAGSITQPIVFKDNLHQEVRREGMGMIQLIHLLLQQKEQSFLQPNDIVVWMKFSGGGYFRFTTIVHKEGLESSGLDYGGSTFRPWCGSQGTDI